MLISLKDYIQESAQEPISESVVSKGFAIAQQRKHASNVSKLQSIASRIQSDARKGISESDHEKREEIVFSLFSELASALRILAEMSQNSINVSTADVLFTESIQSELRKAFPKHLRR